MSDQRQAGIWWLHPAAPVCLSAFAVAFAAYVIPGPLYVSEWKTSKHFTFDAFWITISLASIFAFGTLVGQSVNRLAAARAKADWRDLIPWNRVRTFFNLSFYLCLFGYTVWAGVAVKNGLTPAVVISALKGEAGTIYLLREQYLTTVSGITTMTQFGIAAVALGIPLGVAQGWKGVRFKLVLVFFMALVRAVLHSERLAFIELFVPAGVSYLQLAVVPTLSKSAVKRTLYALAPVGMVGFLLVAFGAFEYNRSWVNFYALQGNMTFWEFTATRLVGYYATALNNGAILLEAVPHPLNAPFYSLNFLWKFPVIKALTESVFSYMDWSDERYLSALTVTANPEFNNPDGLLLPVADFGVPGALLYWLLIGVACGYLYRQFVSCRNSGLFLFPPILTGLVEVTRILYWADGRFFPPIFILLVGVIFFFPSRPVVQPAETATHSNSSLPVAV